MSLPYLYTTGPPEDLETFAYQRGGFASLPDPEGIPFGVQALPLPDIYQSHTQPLEMAQMTGFPVTNSLPFDRFVGTFHQQVHQPQFLSVNEQILWH